MNSFNHYAYGSVVEWMYRYMAGISADEKNPGFKHIILQPTPDTGKMYNSQERINSVKGSYNSCMGSIVSSWTSSGEGENASMETYHAEIPANTTATLYLPVSGNAAEKFEPIKGVSEAEEVEHNGQMTVKLELESGGYDFKIQDGQLSVSYAEGYSAETSTDEEHGDGTQDPDGEENPSGKPDGEEKPSGKPDTEEDSTENPEDKNKEEENGDRQPDSEDGSRASDTAAAVRTGDRTDFYDPALWILLSFAALSGTLALQRKKGKQD